MQIQDHEMSRRMAENVDSRRSTDRKPVQLIYFMLYCSCDWTGIKRHSVTLYDPSRDLLIKLLSTERWMLVGEALY